MTVTLGGLTAARNAKRNTGNAHAHGNGNGKANASSRKGAGGASHRARRAASAGTSSSGASGARRRVMAGASMANAVAVTVKKTRPYEGQKTGTSGCGIDYCPFFRYIFTCVRACILVIDDVF